MRIAEWKYKREAEISQSIEGYVFSRSVPESVQSNINIHVFDDATRRRRNGEQSDQTSTWKVVWYRLSVHPEALNIVMSQGPEPKWDIV